jgi:hypothetical protein
MMKYCSAMTAIFAFVFALNMNAFAHDGKAEKITGTDIELFEKDHAFAGSILQAPFMGVFGEKGFNARAEIHHLGKTLHFQIDRIHEKYSGQIQENQLDSQTGKQKVITTLIELMGIEQVGPQEARIHFSIDGQFVGVAVSGQSFENGHFQRPRFSAQIGEKSVSFEFSGQACFGYSANIAMMILGSYVHLLK